MALLQRARFTTALAACGVGLAICGVTLAVAGESPRPPADPLANLPGDLEMVQDMPCDATAIAAPGGGFGAVACYHTAIVRSAKGETGTELADRLADYYVRRGYIFGPLGGGLQPRSHIGKNACQTMLQITSNPMGVIVPNGAGAGPNQLNGAVDPSTGLDPAAGGIDPATGQTVVPPAGVAGATPPAPTPTPGAAKPPASAPAPTASAGPTGARGLVGQAGTPTTTAPAGTPGAPSTTAATPPGSRTVRRSGTPGAPTTVPNGSQPGAEVTLSAQVASSSGGLC